MAGATDFVALKGARGQIGILMLTTYLASVEPAVHVVHNSNITPQHLIRLNTLTLKIRNTSKFNKVIEFVHNGKPNRATGPLQHNK